MEEKILQLRDIVKNEELIIFDTSVNHYGDLIKEIQGTSNIKNIKSEIIENILAIEENLSLLFNSEKVFTVEGVRDEYKVLRDKIFKKFKRYKKMLKSSSGNCKKRDIPEQYILYSKLLRRIEGNLKKMSRHIYKVENKNVFSSTMCTINDLSESHYKLRKASETDRSVVALSVYASGYDRKQPAVISRDKHIRDLSRLVKEKIGFGRIKMYYGINKSYSFKLIN